MRIMANDHRPAHNDPPPTPDGCASYSPPGSWTAASGPGWWCCKRPASRTEASRAGALPEARCTGSWPAARRSNPSRSDAGRRGWKTARYSGAPDQGSGRNDGFISRSETKHTGHENGAQTPGASLQWRIDLGNAARPRRRRVGFPLRKREEA